MVTDKPRKRQLSCYLLRSRPGYSWISIEGAGKRGRAPTPRGEYLRRADWEVNRNTSVRLRRRADLVHRMARIARTQHPKNAIPPHPKGGISRIRAFAHLPESRGTDRKSTITRDRAATLSRRPFLIYPRSTRAMKQPASPFLICTYRTPGIANASSITCSGGVPFTRV